ncbi:hypothetical protein ACNKHV_02440 [Shigella flexneri]
MYLFLQNFRATLIPTIAVPVHCSGPSPSLPPLASDKPANNVGWCSPSACW